MGPSGLRLRHLRTFVAVARHRSVVRAAAELSVTQPAVSKTMRELEILLGSPLLSRTRDGTFLTPFGDIFLHHAQASLEALQRGLAAAGEPVLSSPPVRVGALPTVSARLLPEAVRRYLKSGAGAVPRIVTGPTGYLTAQLRQGELDIMIGRMDAPERMTGLSFEHLYSEPIVFAVRPGHPLLQTTGVRSVAAFECLMPPPGSVIRPTVDRLFAALNLGQPSRIVETVSLAFSRAYVRASDAIWVISEGVVLDDLEQGILARLDLDTRDTQGPVGITLRSDAALAPAAELLLKALRAVAAEIRGRHAAKSDPGRTV